MKFLRLVHSSLGASCHSPGCGIHRARVSTSGLVLRSGKRNFGMCGIRLIADDRNSSYGKQQAMTFCLGAFKDALWLRQNQVDPRRAGIGACRGRFDSNLHHNVYSFWRLRCSRQHVAGLLSAWCSQSNPAFPLRGPAFACYDFAERTYIGAVSNHRISLTTNHGESSANSPFTGIAFYRTNGGVASVLLQGSEVRDVHCLGQ